MTFELVIYVLNEIPFRYAWYLLYESVYRPIKRKNESCLLSMLKIFIFIESEVVRNWKCCIMSGKDFEIQKKSGLFVGYIPNLK